MSCLESTKNGRSFCTEASMPTVSVIPGLTGPGRSSTHESFKLFRATESDPHLNVSAGPPAESLLLLQLLSDTWLGHEAD